jgi:hypothetical protein
MDFDQVLELRKELILNIPQICRRKYSLFAETCVVNPPNFGCWVDLDQIENPLSSEESYSYGLVTKSRKD